MLEFFSAQDDDVVIKKEVSGMGLAALYIDLQAATLGATCVNLLLAKHNKVEWRYEMTATHHLLDLADA